MTELEQLILTSLERMEAELQTRLERYETALTEMEGRIQDLERHAPLLAALCEELEQGLRRLSALALNKR